MNRRQFCGKSGWMLSAAALPSAIAVPGASAAEAPVTLEADGLSLVDLARELTRQSGVTHRATGKEASQQRVVIFCRDQSAASVRQAVESLLGWTWSESAGAGAKTLTLVKGLNQRKREAALRAQFHADYQGLFRELIERANEGDQERPRDILSNMLVAPSSKALIGGLSSFAAPHLQVLFHGRGFAGPLRSNAPEMRGLLDGVLAAYEQGKPERTVVDAADHVRLELARDATGRPDSLQLSTYRNGQLQLQFNAGHVVQAQVLGRKPGVEPRPLRSPQLLRDRRFQVPLPAQPPLEWPKPPAKEPTQIGWQVRALSRHTPLPLIADCYPEMEVVTIPFNQIRPPSPAPRLSGVSLRKALDRIEEDYFYDWEFRGDWVMLRYRQWYWEPLRQANGKPASGAKR